MPEYCRHGRGGQQIEGEQAAALRGAAGAAAGGVGKSGSGGSWDGARFRDSADWVERSYPDWWGASRLAAWRRVACGAAELGRILQDHLAVRRKQPLLTRGNPCRCSPNRLSCSRKARMSDENRLLEELARRRGLSFAWEAASLLSKAFLQNDTRVSLGRLLYRSGKGLP